jgi:hypothetical protein
MSYIAPLADMRFVLEEVAGLEEIASLPGYEAASADLTEAILGEAGKLAGSVLAPLNQPADRAGSVLENGVVHTPPGFREAYACYVEGGWNGLACDADHGGHTSDAPQPRRPPHILAIGTSRRQPSGGQAPEPGPV